MSICSLVGQLDSKNILVKSWTERLNKTIVLSGKMLLYYSHNKNVSVTFIRSINDLAV